MTDIEQKAIRMLPKRIGQAVNAEFSDAPRQIDEIRLRYGQPPCVSSGESSIVCNTSPCTKAELAEAVSSFSGGAVYPHSDNIKNGFIPSEDGIRVGIVGRANGAECELRSVYDINAVNIRIPHTIPSVGSVISDILLSHTDISGIIVHSPPACGKTTVLREFLRSSTAYRIAAVDTRFELCPSGISGAQVDVLSGYPRAIGIEIAVRTMSPEIIVCDEIGSDEDAAAIRTAYLSGIKVIASAHAHDLASLLKKQAIRGLIKDGIFNAAVGLYRRERSYSHDIRYFGGINEIEA